MESGLFDVFMFERLCWSHRLTYRYLFFVSCCKPLLNSLISGNVNVACKKHLLWKSTPKNFHCVDSIS